MPTAIVENEEQQEQQEEQIEASNENQEEGEQKQDEQQEDPDEVIVSIGEHKPEEEEQQEAAPQWVKNLRAEQRELKRKLREYEEKEKTAQYKQPELQIGTKPTLDSCGYDEDKFESELTAWYDKKRQVDENARKIEEGNRKQQETWQSKLDFYAKAKNEIKLSNFEELEHEVQSTLDQTTQGIIINAAENSAMFVAALGSNKAELARIEKIKDPVKAAWELGKIEGKITMKPRKSAPPAENKITGSGSLAGATDSTLEQLRAKAEKTGDYTQVMQYKNQLRNKKQ